LESELTTVGGGIEPPDSEVDAGFDTDGRAVRANSVSSTSRPLAANYVNPADVNTSLRWEKGSKPRKQSKAISFILGLT
jgi:hypothetical protein